MTIPIFEVKFNPNLMNIGYDALGREHVYVKADSQNYIAIGRILNAWKDPSNVDLCMHILPRRGFAASLAALAIKTLHMNADGSIHHVEEQ